MMKVLNYEQLSKVILDFACNGRPVLFTGAGVGKKVDFLLWQEYLTGLADVCAEHGDEDSAYLMRKKLAAGHVVGAAGVYEDFRENPFKKVGRSGHGTCTLMGHEVAAFKIPLPDRPTQEEIASAIQNIERKKELHEEKHDQLQDLFRTLLHELMTAKTRVHEIEFSTQHQGAD